MTTDCMQTADKYFIILLSLYKIASFQQMLDLVNLHVTFVQRLNAFHFRYYSRMM